MLNRDKNSNKTSKLYFVNSLFHFIIPSKAILIIFLLYCVFSQIFIGKILKGYDIIIYFNNLSTFCIEEKKAEMTEGECDNVFLPPTGIFEQIASELKKQNNTEGVEFNILMHQLYEKQHIWANIIHAAIKYEHISFPTTLKERLAYMMFVMNMDDYNQKYLSLYDCQKSDGKTVFCYKSLNASQGLHFHTSIVKMMGLFVRANKQPSSKIVDIFCDGTVFFKDFREPHLRLELGKEEEWINYVVSLLKRLIKKGYLGYEPSYVIGAKYSMITLMKNDESLSDD